MAYGLTESINFASASSEYAAMGTDSTSLSVTGTDDITLEGWFKITSQPATGAAYFLIWKSTGSSSNRGYELNYEDQAGTKVLTARFFAGGGTTNFWTGSCTYTLTTDTWYHIAVTIDVSASVNSKCVFYVNGVSQSKSEANTGSGATSIFDSTTPFSIGQSIPVLALPQYYSNMNVSLVRVWNTIRSGTDIADNMCNVLGPTTNLQGEWTFGNTYVDTSGNGNTLSGVNTPTFVANLPSTCPITFGSFKTATVNASDVPATQTNFPSYVDLSRLGITTLAEAQSVRVYADDTMTTEWAREIVSATEMHVKIPSLTSASAIYVAWGGGNADYAVTDTYGRNAVWSGYVAVWHANEASGNILSSTGNNTGVDTNTVGSAAGQIGNGRDFVRANSEYFIITNANQTGLGITGNSITMSCWAKGDASLNNAVGRIFWRLGGTGSYGYQLSTSGNSYTPNNAYAISAVGTGGGFDFAFGTAGDATNGTLKHIVATYDGTNFRGYVNASKSTSATKSNHLTNANAQDFYISGNLASYYDNVLDELRIKATVDSDNWITTEYNNQSDESGFWGTWSDVGGATFRNFIGFAGI